MLIAALGQYFFGITIFITSMFLIMLVLVQRGRGGGLAGALGGPGGQSAFGTKAGDLFTRITVGVAAVWILLCAAAVVSLKAKKFTTDVTKRDSGAGSISGTGDAPGSLTTDPTGDSSGEGLGSSLPNAATPGLNLTPPSNEATAPPSTATPPATGEPSGDAGTAEVSDLPDAPAIDGPATDAPAGTDQPATDASDELSLDDPAGTAPSEQP